MRSYILAGMLALGLTGCNEVKEPVRSDYKIQGIAIQTRTRDRVYITNDEIRTFGNMSPTTFLVSPPYERNGVSYYPVMNDRVRTLSKKILEDQDELAYEIDKQLYDISREKTKKREKSLPELENEALRFKQRKDEVLKDSRIYPISK